MEILRILRVGVWGYWKFVTAGLKLMAQRVSGSIEFGNFAGLNNLELLQIIYLELKWNWKFWESWKLKFEDFESL